ncbi:hypothetical protein [Acidovorax sp.]|uniref:hypothetical protein n=1 Tax=Acidovorax sp. TaxID=1872122 RepID=UPI0026075603|nr:hypothetical protein [Acidovorax sp.]
MAEASHPKLAAFIALLLGVALAVLINLYPEHLKAPAWIAYLAAGIFSLAGATGIARAYGHHNLADGLICLVLGGMLTMLLWISLGPGPRHCTSSVGGLPFAASEIACRSAFGIGALLVAFMLAIAVSGMCKRR